MLSLEHFHRHMFCDITLTQFDLLFLMILRFMFLKKYKQSKGLPISAQVRMHVDSFFLLTKESKNDPLA